MIDRLAAVSGADVSRETFDRLQRFARLLLDENGRQNLISPDSVTELWERHIIDGAQLMSQADSPGAWCDIGSGAGLPGLVIAVLSGQPMTLIEPRRLRAEFLSRCVIELGLDRVTVVAAKAERLIGQYDYITARAVARLNVLFGIARHLAHDGTRFILPKGQNAKSELDEARGNWQGRFKLVPSQTNSDAAIVVAEGVTPRENR